MTAAREKEVAAIMFKAILNCGTRFGIPAERLVRDDRLRHELLTGRRRRFPWTDYIDSLDLLVLALGGYEPYREAAALFPEFVPRETAALFQVFVSPTSIYRFVYNVINPLVLPMCHHACVPLADGKLRLEWQLEEGYAGTLAGAWGSLGGAEGVPAYVGLPRSRVEIVEFSPRGTVLLVTPPASRTLLARTLGQELPPFAPGVLNELGEDNELALAHASIQATVSQLEEHDAALAREIKQREEIERTLSQILGTTVGPAFLVSDGNVAPANDQGRLALAKEGGSLRRTLLEAVAAPSSDAELLVMSSGRPGEFLVVRQGATSEIERRIHLAGQRWQLSPRQQTVLQALVSGQTNKEIARALGCAERTVETHISALLQRADAGSRLALVAAFWSDL